MRIRWDILRFVWKYFRLRILDRLLRSISVGTPSSRKVYSFDFGYTNSEHENSEGKEAGEPFEGVADAIRRLGRKFLKYELIFNPPTLVPMVEKYNLETVQRDGWVPEAFLDAGNIPRHERRLTYRCNTSASLLNLR